MFVCSPRIRTDTENCIPISLKKQHSRSFRCYSLLEQISGAMGLMAGLFGGFSGFGIAVMTNATRKIPLSRGEIHFCFLSSCTSVCRSLLTISSFSLVSAEPWNHVMFTIFGFWAGNYYVNTERQLVQDINEIRADKGMPPLVGTNHWTRYSVQEKASS